jgi:hypothetical protein
MAKVRKEKRKEPSHFEKSEKLFNQLIDDELETDLAKTGIVWSGILGIEKPISPSTVAALLSAYDLVLATALVDSDEHWSRAAAFAILGNKIEPKELLYESLEEEKIEDSSSSFTIGFNPSNKD